MSKAAKQARVSSIPITQFTVPDHLISIGHCCTAAHAVALKHSTIRKRKGRQTSRHWKHAQLHILFKARQAMLPTQGCLQSGQERTLLALHDGTKHMKGAACFKRSSGTAPPQHLYQGEYHGMTKTVESQSQLGAACETM